MVHATVGDEFMRRFAKSRGEKPMEVEERQACLMRRLFKREFGPIFGCQTVARAAKALL